MTIKRMLIDVEETKSRMNRTRKANKLNVKPNKDKTKKEEGRWIPKEK